MFGEGIVGSMLDRQAHWPGFPANGWTILERTAFNSNRMTSELAVFSNKLNQKGGLVDNLITILRYLELENTARWLEATGEDIPIMQRANLIQQRKPESGNDNCPGHVTPRMNNLPAYFKKHHGQSGIRGTVRMNETIKRHHGLVSLVLSRAFLEKRDKAKEEVKHQNGAYSRFFMFHIMSKNTYIWSDRGNLSPCLKSIKSFLSFKPT